MKKKTLKQVAWTAVDDRLFYAEGTHIMVNSFKRFHPDIDLVVFRQNTIDKLFKEKDINWYQAKPYFSELLEGEYDRIVNLDADHIVLDRLTEIFDVPLDDYDILFPWNFNDYENASFANITEEMYLQCGMWATTSREFLQTWREANRNAMQYLRKENDTANLVVYNDPEIRKLKLKIVDKDKDYYGCKSLGREPLFEVKGDKTYCRGEQVKLYHFARGNHFPKLDVKNMPLQEEVKELWKKIAMEGQTIKVVGL